MKFGKFKKTGIVSLFISAIAAVFSAGAYAQAVRITVSGVVTDTEGEPLPGVSVMIPGTMTGVSTGIDGDYSITVDIGSVLRFSSIGFESRDIKVDKARYDIVLEEEAMMMDQVVVTGYSQVELRKSTGAVGVVSAEELKGSPLKTVDQLLQGKLAGVNVQMTSGRPGASASVRIRGTNTITGNAEPLWVIDGVPMQKNTPQLNMSQIQSGDFDNIFATGIGNINPNDIESITVLKDAAAAAIYGSQAANGVIVVTTKHGSAGKTSVSYMGSVTVQTKPARDANLMNSSEKLAWEQELWDEFSAEGYADRMAGNTSARYPVIGIVGQIRSGYGRFAGMSVEEQNAYIEELGSHTTDWFDVLFRNTVSTSHYLSVSGGSDKMTYYVSGGFNYNNGLVQKTSATSYSLNAKIDSRPAKWIKFGIQTDFSYQKALSPSNNVSLFDYAYFANPYEQLYNADGSYRADETYLTISRTNGGAGNTIPDNGFNLMREINETSSEANSTTFTIQGNTTINIAKGLTFTGLASFSYSGDMSENINGPNTYAAFMDRPFEGDSMTSQRKYGSITQSSTFNTSYMLRGQLNYARTFATDHALSAIAGAEIRSSYAKNVATKRYGYDSVTGNHSTPLWPTNSEGGYDYEDLVNFGAVMDGSVGQNIIETAFASFYGSLTYTFRNKYVISGTVRSDGSNNFGSDEQFNLNWSGSAAWNIDEEPWMQGGISNVISTLSLRAGFGYTGGVNQSVYPVLIMNYLDYFRNTGDEYYRLGRISNPPNPHLRWEKNQTFNVGMNFGLVNDRIFGEFSYYRNHNMDLVTNVRVPESTGFETQSYNTSEQVNNGVELMLGATVLKFKHFRWRLTANAAYNYNELTKYDSPTGNIFGDYYVGYPLGHIFTGKTSGIDPATGVYKFILRPDAQISSIEDYRDFTNYLYYVGTSNAPWTGGLSTTFSYKRLSLNIAGNFSIGGKMLNNIECPVSWHDVGSGSANEPVSTQYNDLYVSYLNVRKDVTHRWTVANPVTDGYPRLVDAYGPRITDPSGQYLDAMQPYTRDMVTDCVMLEDVSYFKLSTVSLSYDLPDKWVKAMRMGSFTVSFLMNNLFILTNYSGIDPETPGAVYPQSRSFTFSLSCSF
ncbi:MAG TPA: SusC/RagA family TonB-linked outer membrane protein [Candidatus Cryptobacteroides intestinipullorum]|nr:SusC/RagA family TonB-linked outer membrane protein [Candidatus Cryptobacteroides intestinipullorum]